MHQRLVLKGMLERGFGPAFQNPETSSVLFRDLMVQHATELRLGIDYIMTREDVDADKLAYAGLSFGSGSRLVFSVADDRYKAVVYIGGGIDERVKPTLPEADNVNFAPYIGVPTILINGLRDEEHPWTPAVEPHVRAEGVGVDRRRRAYRPAGRPHSRDQRLSRSDARAGQRTVRTKVPTRATRSDRMDVR